MIIENECTLGGTYEKVISLVLCLILAFSCCTVLTGFAAEDKEQNTLTEYLLGDVDLDGKVTILDATAIQRSLAGLAELNELQQKLGDVDGVEFASSASSSHIVSDSGENVDFGCPLDADLTVEGENPYQNFYDLSLLSEKMNEFFTAS